MSDYQIKGPVLSQFYGTEANKNPINEKRLYRISGVPGCTIDGLTRIEAEAIIAIMRLSFTAGESHD